MNAVMEKPDYVEALKAEFDMKYQSEAFVLKPTLYIEGITCQYRNNYHNDKTNQGKVKMDF